VVFLYLFVNLRLVKKMKYVMVYWSRYGHNKKLVKSLSELLKKRGAETQILTVDEADPTALPAADMYVFSAAAEAFNLQRNMKIFMKRLSGLDGKSYGIMNTHRMKKNRLRKMERLLSKKNMVKKAEVDFQVGKDLESGNAFLGDWQAKLSAFAERI
jgi:menaquinone-dependent protoporphyrinogen IX oxidase